MSDQNISLRELNLNNIRPTIDSLKTPSSGAIYIIIGKRGSGKSFLIKNLLYSKKHIIPTGVVVSGTEDTNQFYSSIFPDIFIHTEYKDEFILKLNQRQTIAKTHLSNPWSVIVLDDCMHNKREFEKKHCVSLFKNGRHWDTCAIISNQYSLDLKPELRTNCDGIFVFKETNNANLKKIYENFASVIPSFRIFCALMEKYTADYSCMYISNQTQSSDWKDSVFYFKADPNIPNFTFGCNDYLFFASERTQMRDDSVDVTEFIKQTYHV